MSTKDEMPRSITKGIDDAADCEGDRKPQEIYHITSQTPFANECRRRRPTRRSRVGISERRHTCHTKVKPSLKQLSQSTSDISNEDKTQSASSDSGIEKNRFWRAITGTSSEVSLKTRRFLRFIKQELHSKRGTKETTVKEIHIAPESKQLGVEVTQLYSQQATQLRNKKTTQLYSQQATQLYN